MQEPVAVRVDRRPVAVRPHAGEAAPVRLEVALVVAPDAAGHARATAGGRRARRPRRARESPSASTTSMSCPSAGKPSATGLIGSVITVVRKHAPTSVPPLMFTIGVVRAADVLEEPAVRVGVPRLAGRADRLQRRRGSSSGSPCGISARTSVGERPSIVTCSDSTSFQSRSCGQSGAPSAKTIVAPTRAGADDRPRAHDPAHVGREVDAVAALDVGLVRGLARDRDEEAALDEERALRPAGRARRVGEEVRRLGVDLDRRRAFPAAASRRSGHARVSRFHSITCSSACGPASSSVARISIALAAAERPVGADHDLRLRVLEPRRDRRRREAGEDRHLDGADVRARVRGDGDRRAHRHVDRDAVAFARRRARRAPRRAASPGATPPPR